MFDAISNPQIAIVILVFLNVLGVLKYKRDKNKWALEVEDSFQKGKFEGEEVVRTTIDKITEDKLKWGTMCEKDLIVEALLALGTYGRRLDRMEEKVQYLIDYKAHSEEMNRQIATLQNSSLELQNNIIEIQKYSNSVRDILHDATESVEKLNASLGNAGIIRDKVNSLSSSLNGILTNLNKIKDETSHIVKGMYELFNSYGDGPGRKLEKIDENVSEIVSKISDIEDVVNSISGTTNDIDYNVRDIQADVSGIDEIKATLENNFNQYGYDNIYSKVDDVLNELSDVKSAVEETKSSCDGLYWKIENN